PSQFYLLSLHDALPIFVIHDIELSFGEGRRNLVLNDFDASSIPCHNAVGLFDRANPSNIDTHAGVELQCLAAGSCLGITEHHARSEEHTSELQSPCNLV